MKEKSTIFFHKKKAHKQSQKTNNIREFTWNMPLNANCYFMLKKITPRNWDGKD